MNDSNKIDMKVLRDRDQNVYQLSAWSQTKVNFYRRDYPTEFFIRDYSPCFTLREVWEREKEIERGLLFNNIMHIEYHEYYEYKSKHFLDFFSRFFLFQKVS